MTMNELIIFLENKPLLLSLLCAVTGYLIGSVSFARIINYLVTRDREITAFSEPVPHSDEVFESDIVSATLVTKKIGARYGCMTSIADMLKVALPVLAARLLFTDEPYYLIVGLFGVIGHNLPAYYNFKGGRGESPILGILLVINWFGLLIVNILSIILGFITGSVLVLRWSGYVLMIFWLWYYFNDYRFAVFMVLINFFFWFSMRKDLARFIELKKKRGISFSEEDVSEFIVMGRGLGRALDRYSLRALLKRLFTKH